MLTAGKQARQLDDQVLVDGHAQIHRVDKHRVVIGEQLAQLADDILAENARVRVCRARPAR